MNRPEIERAFEEIFDQALVFHCFADYMRDYLLYVYCTSDPRTGIEPEAVQYRFTNYVRVDVNTQVRDDVWRASLDDRLIKYETGVDLDGFVWGVKWQCLYPGLKLVDGSTSAAEWAVRIGIDFREATVTTEAQSISLVFSDLEVTELFQTRRRSRSPAAVQTSRSRFREFAKGSRGNYLRVVTCVGFLGPGPMV